MMRTIHAIYEGGVLRPLQSLDGIEAGDPVPKEVGREFIEVETGT